MSGDITLMSELETVEELVETPEPVETESAELEAEATEDVVEESATSEEDAEKPKKRSRAEERINALTREKYEAQKAAEAARRQVAEYQEYLQRQQTQPQTEMPKLADYDYDEGRYQQAVQAWNHQQLSSYQEQQQQYAQQQAYQAEQMRQQQVLQAKIAEGQQKYPDFVQKVNDPNLPPLREINPAAFQAVMESDAAADVAYYLASNPQEVYAFASMNPVQAIRTVAQIESRLGKTPTKGVSPGTPPTRLRGNVESVKDPEKMSTEEWLDWRNAQLSKR
jgi:chromosome segregation ATPase